jgi:hypothetical protein
VAATSVTEGRPSAAGDLDKSHYSGRRDHSVYSAKLSIADLAPGRLARRRCQGEHRSRLIAALAELTQQIADATCRAKLAADIGREAQITVGVEKARFSIGRQLAHDFGKGSENRLDLMRFEPPLRRHVLRLRRDRAPRLAQIAVRRRQIWLH